MLNDNLNGNGESLDEAQSEVLTKDFIKFKYKDEKNIDKGIAEDLLNSEYFDNGILTIPENFNGMTTFEAFKQGESIKSINFNNIETIGNSSFYGCKNLIEIYGDKVTKIDAGAFSSCDKLNKINFPNVNEIRGCAFYYCKNLTQISFPNIQLVDLYTFATCEKLQQIQLPSVTKIQACAFGSCSNLENVDLPNAETIGTEAFYFCKKLHEINIPKVSTLESDCFYGCESLTEINLPSVTTIKGCGLHGCDNLTKISLPSITNFSGILSKLPSSLKKIYIPSIESFDKSIFRFYQHLEEIITGTPEQCELIFNSTDEENRKKLIDGTCKLFYEGEVWDCQAYLEQIKRQGREKLIQESQQIIDNFFEALKTPEDDIRKDEICPICQSELKKLESGNFVCTMHEDPKSKVQHQICKDCFFGLIKFNDYTSSCPMCKKNLEIPDDVIKAIKAITELEQQDNN